ncbi:hypothetical protein SSX86_024991 [Deinandra increscens subsp. villosa]|uniref:Uncharacterized protein n=1 Tax=Deinandra increscens subsp. villosa TaxID=3103831 RepID=A0AAP0CDC6_9ASTR
MDTPEGVLGQAHGQARSIVDLPQENTAKAAEKLSPMLGPYQLPESPRLQKGLGVIASSLNYIGKQVQSAIKIKNTSKSHVAFKFDEQKDLVAVEQILQVVFLDVARSSPALDKLKRQLTEAEAALETCKKPPEDVGPKIVGDGLVIDEWVSHRAPVE